MALDQDILFERRGAIGLVTLICSATRNAMTREMCVSMQARLDDWVGDGKVEAVVVQGAADHSFGIGYDILNHHASMEENRCRVLDFCCHAFRLAATIKHYPKPYIALVGGNIFGAGAAISVNGQFRVADETASFAVPETGFGLVPLMGASHFLPGVYDGPEIGLYLALTGTRLTIADVYHEEIATNFVARNNRYTLIERLAKGETVGQACLALATPLPDTFAPDNREAIERVFAAASIEEILASLEAEGSDWAHQTAVTIRSKSPTSTKLALRLAREGARLDFDDCLRMEWRALNRILLGHDYCEGVRVTIVGKNEVPEWRPKELEAVSDADIDAYLKPLEEGDLRLCG
jgi:enoyl-CoA hydratase/carnithine racemase